MTERVLVCVAWPYANGPLHLGHVAGSLLPPDVFARYHRMRGHEVAMVSGSDMHGTPIMVAAEKAGIPPEEFAERNRRLHNEALDALAIKFDLFTSTATKNHERVVHELFLALLANGLIDKRLQTSPYDAKAKRFLPDRYVEGECPHCRFADARGDQCDNCGRTLDPQELLNPRSKLTGTPPEYRETEHYFLRLDLLQEDLKRWVAARKDEARWRPSVVNFTEQWLKEGLKPRAITRDLLYGVRIPDVPAPHRLDAPDAKRIYVWFEAVIGYLSATIEWAEREGKPDAWKRFWHGGEARIYNFLGKDNIPFHTIIWPGMLLGYGGASAASDAPDAPAGASRNRKPGKLGTLDTPWDVPANEFLQMQGAKFSKSRGNAFYVLDLLQHFDADQVRYYLTVNMPEKGDTDWTWPDFVAKVNDELADTLGNYVNRILTFLHTFRGGYSPRPSPEAIARVAAKPEVHDAEHEIAERLARAADALEGCRFKEALSETMAISRLGNRAITILQPWKEKVDAGERADVINAELLWHLGIIKTLAVNLQPFLPRLSDEVWHQLGESGPSPRTVAERSDGKDHWPAARLSVAPGQKLGDIKPLVRKLDLKAVLAEFGQDNPQETKSVTETPAKPQITIDDFAKLDLRVGKVLSCEPHPKADKLWVLQVDLGTEKRQILAGLREHVKADELIGKSIVVIANLQPRTIRGLESQGMVLAAEHEGIVAPLTPAKDVSPGAGIK